MVGFGFLFVAVTAIRSWATYSSPLTSGGDFAADSIRARDAWTQTTGIYSKWDFHHPGPALFWLKWVGNRIGDLLPLIDDLGGQLLAQSLLAAAAIGILGFVLAESSGRVAAIPAAFVAAAVFGGGTHQMVWAPTTAHWFVLLGFGGIAGVWVGRRWGLPVAVGSGLAAAHLHLMYVPAGAMLVAAAIGVRWATRKRAAVTRGEVIAAAVVSAVFLLPVLAAVARGDSSIGDYVSAGNDEYAGWVRPWEFALLNITRSVTPYSLGDDTTVTFALIALVVLGVLLAAVRRRQPVAIVTATCAVAWLAYLTAIGRYAFVTKVIGGPILGVVVIATVAAILPAISARAACAAGAVAASLVLFTADRLQPPNGVAEQALRDVGRADDIVVDHLEEPSSSYIPAAAFVLVALESGRNVCVVERRWPYWIEPERVCDELPAGATVVTFTDRYDYEIDEP